MDQTMPMSSFLIVSNLEIFLVFLSTPFAPGCFFYLCIICAKPYVSLPLYLLDLPFLNPGMFTCILTLLIVIMYNFLTMSISSDISSSYTKPKCSPQWFLFFAMYTSHTLPHLWKILHKSIL